MPRSCNDGPSRLESLCAFGHLHDMADREDIDRASTYPTPFPVGSWLVPGFWAMVLALTLLLLLAG